MTRLVLALLTAAALQVTAAQTSGAQDAEAKYQALLAMAKADPAAVDWQALRFAFADRPSFSPYGDAMDRTAIRAAKAAGDWEGLLAAANKVLGVNYVDAEAHVAAAVAYGKLGRHDEGKRAHAISVAIIKSIMQGRDGKSPEQAFVVISVAEEYALLSALRYRREMQALVKIG